MYEMALDTIDIQSNDPAVDTGRLQLWSIHDFKVKAQLNLVSLNTDKSKRLELIDFIDSPTWEKCWQKLEVG